METKNLNPAEQKNVQTPYVIFNTGILDPNQQENNSLYDPNFISSYYNNSQNQMQQQMNMEMKNPEQMNYLNNFHSFYDYEKNQFIEQPQKQEKRNEGDDVFDPYNIRGEETKGDNESKTNKINEKHDQVDPKIFQDIDYDKYISKNFSNFQPQGGKKNIRKNNNVNAGTTGYDKDEINNSVNQYYASFYQDDKKMNDGDRNNKNEESKFEEPMSRNRKRRNRFEDAPEK
jgi:hypothetical protein